MAAEEKQNKFGFQHVPTKKFLAFESSDVRDSLMKWGMINRTVVQMYTYDKYFQLYQKDKFIQDFFEDPNVTSSLQIFSSSNTPGPLGLKAVKAHAEHIPCTITSMDFFDRLYEKGVVRENGNIKKCIDEDYEDFLISDELRKTLLLEESDFYPMFSEEDRKELLFLIFKHLCLGGQICQYEDYVTPYLSTAKDVYKELVSVNKDPESKKLQVGSIVLKISAMDEKENLLYPSSEPHEQSFSYMCVDLAKRHVYIWHHSWKA
ncbi:cilia- and flagella-associated protein 300-like [Actinia tenebrosa]|uniref:Cilia- and flagella-associated protein 300 n=1 Tax=Actinia tenebrosa TaxID=6105 RepID=A0A6P8HG94_ACTTE|nr:cilia- and flagella-associated protein 300-like [Actinia tenebrosa]